MSTEDGASSDTCCAACGISAIDDVELKMCDGGCDLVKYCGDECQINHKEQHVEECKKRKAELRDRDLFTMPERSHLSECPICCLPLPIDATKSTFMPCCSKLLCNGCNYANEKREVEAGLEHRCAFCREPVAKSEKEVDKNVKKRIKKKCPVAMYHMGRDCIDEGDYDTALEYLTSASELGDAGSHYGLSIMYHQGQGVEKDKEKEVYHLEQAAIGGHHMARHNLGCFEANNGRFDRAKKHFIIAANLGYHDSLNALRLLHADGYASKKEYADSLRSYQSAVEATKSSGRKRAEEAKKNGEIK